MKRVGRAPCKAIAISTCFSCRDADGPETPTPRRGTTDFSILRTQPGLRGPISRLPSSLRVGAGTSRGGGPTTNDQGGIAGTRPIADPESEGIELMSHTSADSAQRPAGDPGSVEEPPIVASRSTDKAQTSPSLILPTPNPPTEETPLELSATNLDEHEISHETRQRRRISSHVGSLPRQHRRRSYLESLPRLSQPGEDDNPGRLAHPPFGVEDIFPVYPSPNKSQADKGDVGKVDEVKYNGEKGESSKDEAAKGNGGTA